MDAIEATAKALHGALTKYASLEVRGSAEDAIVQGVDRADKTLKNVKGGWVKD